MNIILLQDLITDFLLGRNLDNKGQTLMSQILSNEKSVFVHSRRLIEEIEKAIPAEFHSEFTALVTRFADSGGNVSSSGLAEDFDSEVEELYSRITCSVLAVIANKPTHALTGKIQNIVYVSRYEKPNFDWLVIELAISHPKKVTVAAFDFGTNGAITKFVKNLFQIPRKLSRISIFDRSTRDFNHGRFDSLKTGASIDYYTYRHKYFDDDVKEIKAFFRNHRIFTTRNNSVSHSRKLVFDDLIVIADNDWKNLDVDGDWSIDVQFCPETRSKWLNHCNKFQRFNG